MLNDKVMVADVLAGMDANLKKYAGYIAQTDNIELRNTLEQIRNTDEISQFELYDIAKARNYHQPAPKARREEIDMVRQAIQQG
ncbi:MAG: hypothetical protein K0R15_112 [Clostridiales bacterium]|jgi:spore coat protein CotF|nr:hypothetical protein [Clostridiales bacterium]